MSLFIANDHAGFVLKQHIIQHFNRAIDLGSHDAQPVDYPDYAQKLAEAMKRHPEALGILVCGSGTGMAISANRHRHLRAAVCSNSQYAMLARAHNNCNVIALGARFIQPSEAIGLIEVFINTPFAGDRHLRRVEKLK